MMGEEPVLPIRESRSSEDVPEDTPHYLNPKVLNQTDEPLDFTGEEQLDDTLDAPLPAAAEFAGADEPRVNRTGSILTEQPPEKIESVLNSGMQFIGGLFEMATGQKMEASEADGRLVRIDKATGEVTLKFKLPGF
jgi:hypothetical protein